MKIFIYIVIVLVAIAVIAGFFIVGSPQEERLRRFDEKRVQDLQSIQYQIINYWTSKSVLPVTLSNLNDSISGFIVPKDPVSGLDYTYRIKNSNNLIFELCANFETAGLVNNQLTKPVYPYGMEENWQHDKGMKCFERKIDPQLYPPKIPPVK